MTTLVAILFGVLAVAYVLVVAIRPVRTTHSIFELKRRGDEATLRRERLLGTVGAVRLCLLALLAVLAAAAAIAAWQGLGVLAAIALVVIAVPVSRIGLLARYVAKRYAAVEPWLLTTLEKWPLITWVTLETKHPLRDQRLESPEHLLHLVETSGQVLDDAQRIIITNGVHWHTTPVSDVMTLRTAVQSVKVGELLGPLVLDDLHRSGHNRFPVVRKGLDAVVGILDITDLLDLSASKSTPTAEEVMSPQAPRIEADEPLPSALAMLQQSRQHMLVVVDGDGKTVGLVTLADVTRSLLGKTGVK